MKRVAKSISATLSIISLMILQPQINAGTKLLNVSFINVHQGDSTLIQTPDNKVMLIDAGKNEEGQNVVDYLKSKGIAKIDVLIGTHPDSDHIGGLDTVIDNFNIGQIIMPSVTKDTATYKDVIAAANRKKLKITRPVAGSYLNLGTVSKTQILAPVRSNYEDSNDFSVVVRTSYKNNSFIFTGDAEKYSELDMISKGYNLKSDVLKVGHHGSNSSTSAQFLVKVKPKYAVISVGHNSYGHPTSLTLNKLAKIGAQVFRTDQLGTIVMTSDGNNIKVDKKASTINPNLPSKTNNTTVKSPIITNQNTNKTQTVYITKTGTKYHVAGCRYLKDSQIAISLSEAKAKGLQPCNVCNPPK